MSPQPNMDTSQQIKHVFRCRAANFHLTPGFKLLQSGDITKCPECGAEIYDITDTPMGEFYISQVRFDLGDRPSTGKLS